MGSEVCGTTFSAGVWWPRDRPVPVLRLLPQQRMPTSSWVETM